MRALLVVLALTFAACAGAAPQSRDEAVAAGPDGVLRAVVETTEISDWNASMVGI